MSSAPISRTTSSPVFPGIWTSRKTRSGLSDRTASTAAAPLSTLATMSTPPSAASRSSTRWRASGSSSTMRTRIGRRSAMMALGGRWCRFGVEVGRGVVRQHDLRDGPAFGRPVQRQPLVGAVELLETRARVAEPDAPTSRRRLGAHGLGGVHAGAVVPHGDHDIIAGAASAELDAALPFDLAYPVHDRVLDERLQDEVGHERVHHVVVDVLVDRESTLKADLHDVQVQLKQLELAGERDLLLVRSLERHSQELAQARDHAPHA